MMTKGIRSDVEAYAYLVPFVKNDDEVFLKTIIPGRKATKTYLGGATKAQHQDYAQTMFKKDARINIRLPSKDLRQLQKKALAEGIPYQTLVASILHKYVEGRFREDAKISQLLELSGVYSIHLHTYRRSHVMTPGSTQLFKLAAEALKLEDCYLQEALTRNTAYSSDKNGLLSINNERYYQFVITRHLFGHLNRRIALEKNFIDLVVFSADDHKKHETAIEMKRWMSSTGNSEIEGIRQDFKKLQKADTPYGLMLIFSSNPKGSSIQEHLDFLSKKIDLEIEASQWVYECFDTIGNDGKDNDFWVAGYEVKSPEHER